MENSVIQNIKNDLKKKFSELEKHFEGDFLNFYGQIYDGNENFILKLIENIPDKKEKLFVLLTTSGGSAIAVERYVNIFRANYKEVNFIIPDYAYSAGTIMAMSGDKIFMDYFSVLGPIDPQVQNKDGKWVPALGYLDKINELVELARTNKISQSEFIILKEFDLAELRSYEQARELSIELLKKWLVNYKFKDWSKHRTNELKKEKPVTSDEKNERAEEIAKKLSDNKIWKSHGRPLNIDIIKNELKLEIEDYSENEDLRKLIRSYYELLNDFIKLHNLQNFFQTRNFIL